MTRVQEEDVQDALLRYTGEGSVSIGEGNVTIEIDSKDIHTVDSPDCIFQIIITYELFGDEMRVELPLPVEAEATGLDSAREDLKKLIERENYIPEFPMLVVAESSYGNDIEQVDQTVEYHIRQIPERILDE